MKITDKLKSLDVGLYEYLYFFAMVIYMAYMTPETRVMNGGLTTRTFAFFIPVVLTIILLLRHHGRIAWNRYIAPLLLPLLIWSLIEIRWKNITEPKLIVNYFYIYYAAIVSIIHIEVFGKKLFSLYEDVIVILAEFSLAVWFLTIIAPDFSMSIARLFPETGSGGYNFLYLVNWIDTGGRHVLHGIIRNSGCSWEPGRYAIMLGLGLLFNLYRTEGSFKNKNFLVLIVAIASTMSTTGYIFATIILLYFYIQDYSVPNVIKTALFFIPFVYIIYQFDFMGGKLEVKGDMMSQVDHIMESYSWTEMNNENDGTAYAMDRLPSMYFELENFIHDPILGYGACREYSYFYNYYTPSIGFCGGLVQMISVHGIFLGLLLMLILYKSSKSINYSFNGNKPFGFFIYSIVAMISYPIIWFPLFSAFWFCSLSKKFVKI